MLVTANDPKDYINSLPEELRGDIQTLDEKISAAIPQAIKVMWEGKFWGGSDQKIIGYGTMHYVGSNKKEGEWFLIGLAQQKNYITVFINGVKDKMYLIETHKDEFGKAKVGKSTISFKKLEDINLDKVIQAVKEAYNLANSQ